VCHNGRVIRRLAWRFAVIGTAVLLVVVRWPATLVEWWYSRLIFPQIQWVLTGASNLVPFALLDVLIAVVVVWVVWATARMIRERHRGWWQTIARTGLNLATVAAAVCIAFYACWGLNYQREPVTAWLDFDPGRLTPERAAMLADQVVAELVTLQDVVPPSADDGDRRTRAVRLVPGFDLAVRAIGLRGGTIPGRPKHTLLNPYFTRAGVSGMTDPFFLETLTSSNLLPVEQPAVIAHEWAHLAGLALESEASFVGWLTCIHSDRWAQYSGWLSLFLDLVGSLDPSQRRAVMGRVPARAIRDIAEMRQRNERDQVRAVSQVAWRTYDSYLKTNRVASGVRNYSEVVRLVLGIRFETDWIPARR
jgi:hypothetical protein